MDAVYRCRDPGQEDGDGEEESAAGVSPFYFVHCRGALREMYVIANQLFGDGWGPRRVCMLVVKTRC